MTDARDVYRRKSRKSLEFVKTILGIPPRRKATCIALHGGGDDDLDLVQATMFLRAQVLALGLPEAEWITFTYRTERELKTKKSSFSVWLNQGCKVPEESCDAEFGRRLTDAKNGFVDWTWYASVSREGYAFLSIDLTACQMESSEVEGFISNAQAVGRFWYGYQFMMDVDRGPALYALGSAFNPEKNYSSREHHELSKWAHAKGECKKLGLPISDLLRDVYSLNFLNPHHLAMQIKGQSLKDWIEADPKHGVLKPLIEGKLWTWTVPENRIQATRKVLGPERLLISWGDFNTPSGGPLGHTYGAKPGAIPIFKGQPPTKDDERWIAEGLEKMKPIFTRYNGESPVHFDRLIAHREPLFSKLLDIAFTAWSQDERPDRPNPDETLHAFAAALGEHLVKHYRMAWYVVDDEYGRSLCVCHRGPGGAQTWNHPIDAVAKRIDRGETGFIAGIVDAVGEQIKRG